MRHLNTNQTGEGIYREVKRHYDSDGPEWPYWSDLKPHQRQPWNGIAHKMNTVAGIAQACVRKRDKLPPEIQVAAAICKLRVALAESPEVLRAFETVAEALDAVGND